MLLALVVVGCGGDDDGASNGIPESQSEQVASGRSVYTADCAQCHGEQGEGGTGPVLIGGNKRIASYETTDRLYDYVSRTMPFDAPGTLSENQYWNVIAYLLVENDLLAENTVLAPESESIELRRE